MTADLTMARLFEQGGTVSNPKALLRDMIAEIERLRGQTGAIRNMHNYVLDFCDEYLCINCGQNPCPTLAVLEGESSAQSEAIEAIQAAVVTTINALGAALLGPDFRSITSSPIEDEKITEILSIALAAGSETSQ